MNIVSKMCTYQLCHVLSTGIKLSLNVGRPSRLTIGFGMQLQWLNDRVKAFAVRFSIIVNYTVVVLDNLFLDINSLMVS